MLCRRRCRTRIIATAILLLIARRVAGDPAPEPPPARTHVVTDELRLLCVPPAPPARCMDLPPGHFVDRNTWSALDVEMKRAQDAETRLAAENQSLRVSAASVQPGWYVVAGAVLTGLTTGWYVHSKL